MACGLPVVATSINGTEDFIQPGVNGDFVESDPKHIAKVIEPLIQDAGKRQEMGRNARRDYERRFTAERNYAALMEVYERAIRATRQMAAPNRTGSAS